MEGIILTYGNLSDLFLRNISANIFLISEPILGITNRRKECDDERGSMESAYGI